MLPLERFNAVWRPDEPERLRPVYVERVTIREALRAPDVGRLLGSVQLVEPTFQVCACKSCAGHTASAPTASGGMCSNRLGLL